MTRTPPCPGMEIPVSLDVFHQLTSAACRAGFEKESWEIAAEAIDEWMRRHNPDALSMPATSGYQWKRLFLPTGTLLRTVFKGKNYHCLVEGDKILYEGQAVSPSGFVNAVGGVRRNAWESTWILFPGTRLWKLANSLRTRDRPSRQRMQSATVQQTPAASSPPATPHTPDRAPASESGKRPLPHAAEARAPRHADHRPFLHADVPRAPRAPSVQPLTQSPPHAHERFKDRRVNGDDRMITLLCQELLPFLHRIGAIATPPPAMRAPLGG